MRIFIYKTDQIMMFLALLAFSIIMPSHVLSLEAVSLVVGTQKHSCAHACSKRGLECRRETDDLNSLHEQLVKEMFYMSQLTPCSFTVSARGSNQPAYDAVGKLCYGYKYGNSMCGEIDENWSVDRGRFPCLCSAPEDRQKNQKIAMQNWTKAGNYYYKADAAADWMTAIDSCLNHNAILPVIRSPEQNELFRTFAQSQLGLNGNVWLYWNLNMWYDNYHGITSYSNFENGADQSLTAYMDLSTGKWKTRPQTDIVDVICSTNIMFTWSKRRSYLILHPSKHLDGFVMQTIQGIKVQTCATKCKERLDCLSANYNKTTSECQLMPQLAQYHTSEIQITADSVYIEKILSDQFD